MNAQHDCSRQPRRGASDDIDVECIGYCGPRCKDWRLMTGTVPNFFDTAHAQQELQDWDRMAPVGREFGSPTMSGWKNLITWQSMPRGACLRHAVGWTHPTRRWVAGCLKRLLKPLRVLNRCGSCLPPLGERDCICLVVAASDANCDLQVQHAYYVLRPKRPISACVYATERGRGSLPGPRWCSPS